MLIVMAVLSLVGGAIAINISRATVEQKFRTEVSMIVDELRLAQDLMLVLGTDVHVKFQEDPGVGIHFWLELETPLQDSLKRELLSKGHILKTVRGFSFDDELDKKQGFGTTKGVSDVKFLSKGMVMSQGIIRLMTSIERSSDSNVLDTFIPLAGYPRSIHSIDGKEAAEAMYQSFNNSSLDQQLTADTFSKFPEKKKTEGSKSGKDGDKNPKEENAQVDDKESQRKPTGVMGHGGQ
jgi:hypothetical protein